MDDTDDTGHLDGEAIDRRVLDRVRPLPRSATIPFTHICSGR